MDGWMGESFVMNHYGSVLFVYYSFSQYFIVGVLLTSHTPIHQRHKNTLYHRDRIKTMFYKSFIKFRLSSILTARNMDVFLVFFFFLLY